MTADERAVIANLATVTAKLEGVVDRLEKVEGVIERIEAHLNRKPSLPAWIAASVAVLGFVGGPVAAIYWRFSDAIVSLQRSDESVLMRLKQLEKEK